MPTSTFWVIFKATSLVNTSRLVIFSLILIDDRPYYCSYFSRIQKKIMKQDSDLKVT